jgi:hypothetical protein
MVLARQVFRMPRSQLLQKLGFGEHRATGIDVTQVIDADSAPSVGGTFHRRLSFTLFPEP